MPPENKNKPYVFGNLVAIISFEMSKWRIHATFLTRDWRHTRVVDGEGKEKTRIAGAKQGLKFQITNPKFQVNSKFQFQMTKTLFFSLEFEPLGFICYLVLATFGASAA
jgi:hypothetical protein